MANTVITTKSSNMCVTLVKWEIEEYGFISKSHDTHWKGSVWIGETLITIRSWKKSPKRDTEGCTTQTLPVSDCIESIQDNTDCAHFGSTHIQMRPCIMIFHWIFYFSFITFTMAYNDIFVGVIFFKKLSPNQITHTHKHTHITYQYPHIHDLFGSWGRKIWWFLYNFVTSL